MIKAVLFDIGGTVHTQVETPESRARFAHGCLELLNARGVLIGEDPERFIANVDRGIESYKDYAMERLIELDTERVWKDFALNAYEFDRDAITGLGEPLTFLLDNDRKEIRKRPELNEMCEMLRARGYRMGVISNIISRGFVPYILEKHGVSQYFEKLILSSECGIRKPSPAIFDLACREMGLTREECCYVGDTVSRDIIGACKAQWECIIKIENPLAAHRDKGLADCGYEPHFRVNTLTEIPAVLDGLRQTQ